MTPLLFNRHIQSPSGIGTTLKWGDIAQLPVTRDFVEFGSCRRDNPATFYPTRGEQIITARAICARCPVRPECLAWALAHEIIGVWGGTSARQRHALRRQTGIEVTTPTLSEIDHAVMLRRAAS